MGFALLASMRTHGQEVEIAECLEHRFNISQMFVADTLESKSSS